ncbi:hypothetical protein B0H14DRAFT_3899477, partial [Mycena olivaceomarginata]
MGAGRGWGRVGFDSLGGDCPARFRTHTRCIYRVWVGVFVWRMRLRDFLQPYHTIPRRYITTSIFIVVNHSLALLYLAFLFFPYMYAGVSHLISGRSCSCRRSDSDASVESEEV